MNSTDDIIELADTELAAAAHRVYDAGRVAGWTATDYDAAIGWTKVGSPRWDVLLRAPHPQAPPAPRGDVVNDALNQARAEWAEANDRVGRHEDEVAMAAQAADIIIGCRAGSDLIAEATANERRTVRNWLQAKRDRDAAQAAIIAAVAAQYAEYGEVDA